MNDPPMLAIVGLSNAYLSIMILAPILGLNTAQDTLTSQAFGRGDLHLCGIYLSRGRLILITFFMTLGIGPALFSQKIFLAIGQDPEVSRLAHIQVLAGLPAMLCYGLFDLYKRWLSDMLNNKVPMISMIVASVLHVPLCVLFIYRLDMGVVGLAVATSCREFILLSFLIIYCNCSQDLREKLPPACPIEAYQDWIGYLRLAVPAALVVVAEMSVFQVLTVLAGRLGVVEQAAMTIITSVQFFLLQISMGMQEAMSGIIGNCVGANKVVLAKRFFDLILKVSIFKLLLIGIIIVMLRAQITSLFTNDD